MIESKGLILTIDDEAFIRNNFKAFLEDYGYDVLTAENGEVGIQVYKEKKPDLILVDLRMPRMDGLQVLRAIGREDEFLPVIVVSGTGVLKDAIKAVRLGAYDYLLKPIEDMEVLLQTVEQALEKAELKRQNQKYQEQLETMVEKRTEELKTAINHLTREVSTRKKAEKQLSKSQQMLDSIIKSVPDIIYRLSPDGNITFISDSVKQYGYNPEEVIGQRISDFVHPDDREKAQYRVNERRTGDRKTNNFEMRIFTKKGKKVPLDIISSALEEIEPVMLIESEGLYDISKNKEKVFLGSQGIARDITQRKIAELKIQNSLKEKEALLKEIHHRVKNNMQVISSLLNLQMRQSKDKNIQNILMESKNRIRSMAMVHETVYNSDIFTQIKMKQYIQKIAKNLMQSYLTDYSKIKYIFNLDDISVSLDSSIPLGLILNEIITNSIKHAFTDGQKGEIIIELKQKEKGHARLSIQDNGAGFELEDMMDRKTMKTLGLKLIKTLVNQIKGNVEIISGQGTKYLIDFSTQIDSSSFIR